MPKIILNNSTFCILLVLTQFNFKDISAVVWPCQDDKDCNSVPLAKCSDYGSCICPAGYVFSTNLIECIPASLYGDQCTETVQCSYMPSGASCRNGICQCDDGYTYIKGRCKILTPLEENCTESEDCKFGADRESVICNNGKCMCADGYYQRSKDNCRRKSMGISDPCVVDSDCDSINPQDNNDAKCIFFKCEKEEKQKSRSFREIAVQTSLNEFSFNNNSNSNNNNNSSLVENLPLSSSNKPNNDEENIELLSTLSPTSETETKKFGDPCSNIGQPCEHLHHSICVGNICHCKLGYYFSNNVCKAELGEKVDTPDLCKNGNGPIFDPKSSKCVCPVNYFYESDLRTCKKPILLIGSCTTNTQCSPFGAAFCNTTAQPKRCVCEPYAKLDEKRQICELKIGLGSICENNENCHVQHSICSPKKFCVCKSKFIEKDGTCMAGINAECNTNDDCAVDNSTCVSPSTKTESNSCQCKKGFVHFEDNCLKAGTKYGDDCVVNEQCKPLLGDLGRCIEMKCACDTNHHLSYGKCEEKKVVGEKCSRASQCYTPEESKGIECRNDICRCQFGYAHDPTKKICLKPKTNSSSGRPSVLKIITFVLIGSAVFVTSAAIKQAYY